MKDPLEFVGGGNFFRYVLQNSPTGLADPMGLSAADVQPNPWQPARSATKGLTDSGLRMRWGEWDYYHGARRRMIVGGINDLRSGFSHLKKAIPA